MLYVPPSCFISMVFYTLSLFLSLSLSLSLSLDTRSEGGGKSIRVQFVDCGTQEWVNEVWELDPAHLTLPSLVIYPLSCVQE